MIVVNSKSSSYLNKYWCNAGQVLHGCFYNIRDDYFVNHHLLNDLRLHINDHSSYDYYLANAILAEVYGFSHDGEPI